MFSVHGGPLGPCTVTAPGQWEECPNSRAWQHTTLKLWVGPVSSSKTFIYDSPICSSYFMPYMFVLNNIHLKHTLHIVHLLLQNWCNWWQALKVPCRSMAVHHIACSTWHMYVTPQLQTFTLTHMHEHNKQITHVQKWFAHAGTCTYFRHLWHSVTALACAHILTHGLIRCWCYIPLCSAHSEVNWFQFYIKGDAGDVVCAGPSSMVGQGGRLHSRT